MNITQGGLSDIISLNSGLSAITNAEKVTLSIKLSGTPYENSYSLWIYPADADTIVPDDIIVSNKLDKQSSGRFSCGCKSIVLP